MDEKSWWDLWNTSYRAEDNRDEISTELFTHVVALMRQVTHGQKRRVLEVGCGTGTLSRRLDFSSYHGLDMSPAAIEIAREKSKSIDWPTDQHPTYEAADFHHWPLPAEKFDVALCVDAISAFRDQASALRKMGACLAEGRSLVLTSANPFVYKRIRRVGGVRLENGPVSHWHSSGELRTLLHQAGMTVQRSYTIMPRGNMGILRLLNSPRLNHALGQTGYKLFRQWKETLGLGQYIVVVATKDGNAKA